ncbi:MAG: IS200/IS605 family element transposase accessory protein TnpB [Campylobacterales bacterium]|nr:IS200/IS605 family element transposase accessory protein TnpB [Campylobacterales bacterium]
MAKLHEKVADSRKDYLHQISHKLVCESQATSFIVEDLNVKGLIRNKKLSRHIADVAWGEFIRQLEYKCDWNGKNLIRINRFYPSAERPFELQ